MFDISVIFISKFLLIIEKIQDSSELISLNFQYNYMNGLNLVLLSLK